MAANKEVRSDESLLSRWSRRKLEADRDDADSAPAIEQAPADKAGAVTAQPPEAEAKPLTDADMPDIETLTEESDFSAFMSSGVSDELRNLALRKLFHASVFNIRDGLDEYDEDYTSFEKLGDIVTCDMKHQIEMQQKKLREARELEQQNAALDEEGIEDVETVEEVETIEDEDDGVDGDDEPAPVADKVAVNTGRKSETGNE
jgi:hypothetical protein